MENWKFISTRQGPIDDEFMPIVCICGFGRDMNGRVNYDLIISIYSDDPTKCPKCNREYYFKQFAKVYIKEKQTMKVKVRDKIYDGEKEPVMVILSESEKEQIANMSSANSKYCVYPDKKEWIANNFEGIKKWMNEPIIFTLPKKRD